MRSIRVFRLFFLSLGISCSAAVSHAGEINGSLQDAPSLQVSSLRKFELKTVGLDLEGYFMDLHGVSDPQLRGSQIDAVYPETPMPNFPPGWIPPSLTPLSSAGTRVSWGGAFQGTIANRPIGFGVGLSPQGEANLEQLCARWLRGDQPVTYPYFDPTLPLVQLGPPSSTGTTSFTIRNPVCPPFEAEDRWVGSVYGQVFDRQLGFEQLTIENPLFDAAPPLLDDPTFLPPGETIALELPQTLQAGQSLVVWFHAYQDRRGALSNYVGTNFTAFYATAIPEPGQTPIPWMLVGVGLWRRRRR